jgi:hypothetical protein
MIVHTHKTRKHVSSCSSEVRAACVASNITYGNSVVDCSEVTPFVRCTSASASRYRLWRLR